MRYQNYLNRILFSEFSFLNHSYFRSKETQKPKNNRKTCSTSKPKTTAKRKLVTQEPTTKEITTRILTAKVITTVKATTTEVTTRKRTSTKVTTGRPDTTEILTSEPSTENITTIKTKIPGTTSNKQLIKATTIDSTVHPSTSKEKETLKNSTTVQDVNIVPLATKYDTSSTPIPNRTTASYTNKPMKSKGKNPTTIANHSVITQTVLKRQITSNNRITELIDLTKTEIQSQISTMMFKSAKSRYEDKTQTTVRSHEVMKETITTTPVVSKRNSIATSSKLITMRQHSGPFNSKHRSLERSNQLRTSKTTTEFSKNIISAKSDDKRTASRTTRLMTRLYQKKAMKIATTLETVADKVTTVSPTATQFYRPTVQFDGTATPSMRRVDTRSWQSRSTQSSQPPVKPTKRSRMDNAKGKKRHSKLKCPIDINAAVIDETTGWMYVFSGDKFYLVAQQGLTFGPLSVPDYFQHLKGNVTAAYLRWMTGFLVLFCGNV